MSRALAMGILCLACESGTVSLQVELKTDFIPGLDFHAVELRVEGEVIESIPASLVDVEFASGRGVGTVSGLLPASGRMVEVRLLDAAAEEIATRRALIEHQSDLSVRLLVARGCALVECAPEQTCHAGSCVGAACLTGVEPECGEPQCGSASECTSMDMCSMAECDEGACLFNQLAGACAAEEFCNIDHGCEPLPASCDSACDDGNDCSDDSCHAAGCRFVANGSCASPCATQTEIDAGECAALEAVFSSTNGSGWLNVTDWLLTDTPCSWYGVTCDGGHVTELGLRANGLTGVIPPEIAGLQSLRDLRLGENEIGGTIPVELSTMLALQGLSLRVNRLEGEIPRELAQLTNLTVLNFYDNMLTGEIWVELTNFPLLRVFNLRGNELTGSIPPTLGNMLTLVDLQISENALMGPIPPELGALTELTSLHLHSNQLTGQLPASLTALTLMEGFYLDSNMLDGEIPAGFELWTNVTTFRLGSNGCFTAMTVELRAWLDANSEGWDSGCTA